MNVHIEMVANSANRRSLLPPCSASGGKERRAELADISANLVIQSSLVE